MKESGQERTDERLPTFQLGSLEILKFLHIICIHRSFIQKIDSDKSFNKIDGVMELERHFSIHGVEKLHARVPYVLVILST